MKTLYHAANALEAYMLRDLLQQEGIESHIHGEALQGAIGEMPAAGLVRLMVDEEDHEAGRRIIDRWEATQIPAEAPAPPRRQAAKRSFGIWEFLLGLAIGMLLTQAAYRTSASVDHLDERRGGSTGTP